MDTKALFWIGFLCTCVIDIPVDSVIPPYLNRAKVAPPKVFKPTAQKCCKLGQRTAKKRLSCSAHTGQRLLNRVYKSRSWPNGQIIEKSNKKSKKLMLKITKCIRKYARTFEKCCRFKENYYKELKLCKIKHRRRIDKKKCKRLVRKKYS